MALISFIFWAIEHCGTESADIIDDILEPKDAADVLKYRHLFIDFALSTQDNLVHFLEHFDPASVVACHVVDNTCSVPLKKRATLPSQPAPIPSKKGF